MLFAVGDGPALFYAEIVDGENVRTAESENQKHFNGPGPDATDGDEAFDEFFVGHFFCLLESGDDAVDSFLSEIFHGEDFCAGESGFAEFFWRELHHFLRRGCAAGGAESFDASVNGGGGFAGDGLVSDGFEESFVGGVGFGDVDLIGDGFGDERGEARVAVGEVLVGDG